MLNTNLIAVLKDAREKQDLKVKSAEFKRIREDLFRQSADAEEFLEALDELTKIAEKKSRYQIIMDED
jgi:hypothetical protein